MPEKIADRCKKLVEELQLGKASRVTDVTPLTGGVASDIASFNLNGKTYCAKFALPKLKVAADWYAPVHRNAAEYAWLEFMAATCPHLAVKLYGRSASLNGFVMEFISGKDVYLWKTALLNCEPDRGEAGSVGALLGQIQAASTRSGFDKSPFQNRDDFQALRIEPYLLFTAEKHADLKSEFNVLASQLYDNQAVLVHGDVSPKNILLRDAGPVILDAECATMGDASFDPAFCLNHLLLKSFHLPDSRHSLLHSVEAFWNAYAAHLTSEDPASLEARICRLLPALMLGRVDGKSPVEYLSADTRDQVRIAGFELIRSPEEKLGPLMDRFKHFQK